MRFVNRWRGLFFLAITALLSMGLASFPTGSVTAKSAATRSSAECGQRVKVNVHYRPTKYNFKKSLARLERMAGEPVWGYYQSSSRVTGRWSRKGKCVNVRISVNVYSIIYVAKEMQKRKNPKKYKCHFARILKHEKKHRADDRRSLRNMLKKRNALLKKVNRGQVQDLEKFINYTVRKVQGMLEKYYREASRRSEYFHKTVERSC